MARVIPPSERPRSRRRTARTNREREEQPDRGIIDIEPVTMPPEIMPDLPSPTSSGFSSDVWPEPTFDGGPEVQNENAEPQPTGPMQAGFLSGNVPLLLGGVGLIAGAAYLLTNQSN